MGVTALVVLSLMILLILSVSGLLISTSLRFPESGCFLQPAVHLGVIAYAKAVAAGLGDSGLVGNVVVFQRF